MSDKAREAIEVLHKIATDMQIKAPDLTGDYIAKSAQILATELRRCRAETLREAARIAESWWEGNASDDLYKIADEAEREARDEIHN